MKTILIITLCIVLILVVIYAYFGGFAKITVKLAQQGGEIVVYQDIKGDYKQSGIVMDKIYYSLLNDAGIETYKGYGKFFDNPREVNKEDLRSEAGCIIEDRDEEKLGPVKEKFETKKLPVQKYMIAEFPYKGKGSVIISIMKVYPALVKFAREHGHNTDAPVMEIYDVPNKKIYYRKEL